MQRLVITPPIHIVATLTPWQRQPSVESGNQQFPEPQHTYHQDDDEGFDEWMSMNYCTVFLPSDHNPPHACMNFCGLWVARGCAVAKPECAGPELARGVGDKSG